MLTQVFNVQLTLSDIKTLIKS